MPSYAFLFKGHPHLPCTLTEPEFAPVREELVAICGSIGSTAVTIEWNSLLPYVTAWHGDSQPASRSKIGGGYRYFACRKHHAGFYLSGTGMSLPGVWTKGPLTTRVQTTGLQMGSGSS